MRAWYSILNEYPAFKLEALRATLCMSRNISVDFIRRMFGRWNHLETTFVCSRILVLRAVSACVPVTFDYREGSNTAEDFLAFVQRAARSNYIKRGQVLIQDNAAACCCDDSESLLERGRGETSRILTTRALGRSNQLVFGTLQWTIVLLGRLTYNKTPLESAPSLHVMIVPDLNRMTGLYSQSVQKFGLLRNRIIHFRRSSYRIVTCSVGVAS
ncbi:hypothetical protein PROFUN_11254 [Planoprotostelium fungivorum]|uniref:Uncharacterized protein n=1 Tax=Planoprotostelium fungivorum TaxID=1890364 RepID=A0A2P6NAD9_9EUKA|nr:hypothetical protein PROFUN_11254 [Planoprotostelium fungivorum]